jgi:hypothetical protein
LREPSEIRAQRSCGEVAFPQAGRQQMHLEGGMGIDALEHINKIDGRIHSL